MNQLFFIVGDKRQDDVPYNCKPYTGKALFCDKEQGDEYYAGNDEQKSDLVLFEREILEFQCEHRDFSNQHPAGEEDEKKNDVDIERDVCQQVFHADDESAPEEGIGWRGQTNERCRLPFVQVELCQSYGGKSGYQEGDIS